MILEKVYKGQIEGIMTTIESIETSYNNKYFDTVIKLGSDFIKKVDLEMALKCLKEYKKGDETKYYRTYLYFEHVSAFELLEEYMVLWNFHSVYYYVASSYMEKKQYNEAIEYFFKTDNLLKASYFYKKPTAEYNKKIHRNEILTRLKLAACLFYLARYKEATVIFKWLDEKELLTKVEKVNIRRMYFNKKKQNLLWD